MPPATMIGVRASASRPTSTASRVISNAFDALAKFCPVAANTTHSSTTTVRSTHSWFGKSRSRSGTFTSALGSVTDGDTTGADMANDSCEGGVGGERREDDRALDRLRPHRADRGEGERGRDGAEQGDPNDGSEDGAASARDRRTTDHHRGNGLQLQSNTGIARDGGKAHAVEHGGEPYQRAGGREGAQDDAPRLNANETRRFGVRPH